MTQSTAGNHRARGNTSRAETPALLKGIIRCAHCGSAMGPTFTKKGEKRYRYYLCVQAAKRGAKTCPVRRVSAGEIEGAVLDQLRAVFQAPELVSQTFREARAREAEEVERLRAVVAEGEAHVADLTARAERLLDATGDPASSTARELRLTSRDLDEARERVDAARAEMQALETHAVTEAEVSDALRRLDPIWEELFPAEQARIAKLLVERVDVEPEGIELRLRVDGLRSLAGELDRKEAS